MKEKSCFLGLCNIENFGGQNIASGDECQQVVTKSMVDSQGFGPILNDFGQTLKVVCQILKGVGENPEVFGQNIKDFCQNLKVLVETWRFGLKSEWFMVTISKNFVKI